MNKTFMAHKIEPFISVVFVVPGLFGGGFLSPLLLVKAELGPKFPCPVVTDSLTGEKRIWRGHPKLNFWV